MSRRRFKPGLVPTLVTLILLPIFLRLGFWQLDRAEQKRAMQHNYEQRSELPALSLGPGVRDWKGLEYRRVLLRGTFDNGHQILIDNKIHNGRVGYYVITPLRLLDSDQYVLVNRGWVPAGVSRAVLPDIQVTEQLHSLHGVLVKARRDVFMISEKNRDIAGWPARMQWLDINEFIEETGFKVYPFAVLMDATDPQGYVREWGKVNLDPDKNTSYAMQWFSFAVLLVIIYIVVNLKKTGQEKPARVSTE